MAELFKLVGTIVIDATDATQKIEAVIDSGADLEEKLKGIGDNADSHIGSKSGFGTASVWLGNMLTELTRRAANLGKEFVLSGLKYNAAMEGYEVAFGTLLKGDTEKAKKLMEEITAFALDSPLSVSGVSDAALQLLNLGTAYEDIMPMLEMLGNLSLGDESKMGKIATALSQVMGFGQLYAQEKQQFVNAGVPIYQLLEDYYRIVEGMTGELDLDMMQKNGQILSEHVLGALQIATMSSEEIYEKYGFSGERAVSFYNAIGAMLPTYTGQMQKAGEQTQQTAGAIVEPFQEDFTKKTLPAYIEMMNAIGEKAAESAGGGFLDNAAEALMGWATGIMSTITDWINGEFKDKSPAEMREYYQNQWDELGLPRDESIQDGPLARFFRNVNGLTDGTSEWISEEPLVEWKPIKPSFTLPGEDEGVEKELEEETDTVEVHHPLTKGWWENLFNWGDKEENKEETEGGTSGSLQWLKENLRNPYWQFASALGVPDRADGYDYSGFTDRSGALSESFGAMGVVGIAGLIASVQGLTAAVQSMTGEIPSAISTGVGNITVTGTVTTGNVTLDTGAIVGQIAPRMNLVLGGLNAISGRG